MKKKLIILAGSLMALAIGATTYFSVNTNSGMSLLMQNVEALAGGEGVMNACYTYCKSYPGYVCVLSTNYDFNINCDGMAAWNF